MVELKSSYQRRKAEIAYWKQRNNQLEDIIVTTIKYVRKNYNPKFTMLLGTIGVSGDMYVNDIASRDFYFTIMGKVLTGD